MGEVKVKDPGTETTDAKTPTIKAVDKKEHLMKKFPKTGSKTMLMVLGAFVIVLAGVGTGWFLSGSSANDGVKNEGARGAESNLLDVESADEDNFPDQAEGILEEGGIEGEGTYHLVREGGPTKYVYLTSTVIDLEPYKDKKVEVWGETISGRYAGWLMDVGKVQIIE